MSAPATEVPVRPAHRDPNVLRWLGAYTASMIGDSVYFMALAWAAARTGSASGTGLVLAAGSLPRALLMLGGGVLADRLGPRRVVIGSDAARALLVLSLAAVLVLTAPTVGVLVAVALLFGVVDALFLPAVGALPPRISGPGQLARIQGLRALAARGSSIIGAPLGGVAVATGGPALAFAAAGVLFALSLPLLLRLRIRPLPEPTETSGEAPAAEKAPNAWHDLVDGLRYIRRHPLLGPLMLVIALSELGFVGPLNLGLILLSEQRGWGAAGMGWIVAGFAVGAAGSALVLAVRGRVPRAGTVMCLMALVGATGIAALAQVPSVALAAAIAAFVGLTAGLAGALCGALVQTTADPAYLGRVTSVSTFFTYAIAPLSYPVTGAAVALWGTGPVFAVSAAVCAAGGAMGLAVTTLRRAELPR
ncbi:MFS transporter [Streptomyces griseus]|uniref:MFS transporter n=1 Tax=Streptomyces TaxID=1883 RepID=UPI0029C5D64A|nr:MFS transporter [Streptomyces sp. ID01-9D]WSV20585.1 MFS transporter [Streptomyces fimicarius]WTC90508.1 MFS transporter [Streptomyces griseus]MDX5576478.1 MFS transporter [Streptomyces sp. ID01-9D]MDX5576483.1 MFS transporter [Streptomyces sp. ID01-9D]WTD66862.1 MFS transporter [Streptomyces griseus]